MDSTTAVKELSVAWTQKALLPLGELSTKGRPITSAAQSAKRNSISVRSDTRTNLRQRRGATTVAAVRSKNTDTFCAGGLGE